MIDVLVQYVNDQGSIPVIALIIVYNSLYTDKEAHENGSRSNSLHALRIKPITSVSGSNKLNKWVK